VKSALATAIKSQLINKLAITAGDAKNK